MPESSDYDRIASGYRRLSDMEEQNRRVLYALLKDRSGRCLEVGCGNGLLLQTLLPTGLTLVGVDFSKGMLEAGHRLLSGANGAVPQVQGDGKTLPFPPEQFDLVVCLNMLRVLSPRDIETVLREMVRVCKRGGSLFIDIYNTLNPRLMLRGERRTDTVFRLQTFQRFGQTQGLRIRQAVAVCERREGSRRFLPIRGPVSLFLKGRAWCYHFLSETLFFARSILVEAEKLPH